MNVPEHLWRHPTREAIESLASRFNLPNHSLMQDWEFEVADPSRIDEFVATYENAGLSEDERFTLMRTIIQSFEEIDGDLSADPRWAHLLRVLDKDIAVHICSVWYWADEGNFDTWRVARSMRVLLEKHRTQFAKNAV